MKKNRGIVLIITFAVLALLLLVYFVLVPKMNPDEIPLETTAETHVISNHERKDITAFSYKINGENLAFTYEDRTGYWRWSGDRDFPLNQTTVAGIAEAIAYIPATRVLEAGEISIADAGLEEPAYTFSVTYSDGSYSTYHIGNFNNFNNSNYFMTEGDDRLYMISSGLESYFTMDLYDLAAEPTIATNALSVDKISGYDVVDSVSSKTVTDPALLEELLYLYVFDAVDFKPTEEELKEYGLDSGAATITVHYTVTKEFNNEQGSISSTAGVEAAYDMIIKVGVLSEGNDSQRYVLIDDNPLVYRMNADTLEKLISGIIAEPEAQE